MNPKALKVPSTDAISRKVIMTLLQYAARLCQDSTIAEEAAGLIKNKDFRAVLSLGIQDNLGQITHQWCLAMYPLESTTADSLSSKAAVFSAVQKNEAWQSNIKYLVINQTLQNPCESSKADEPFMFLNYITLVSALSIYEKTLACHTSS
jgi:hypothetical protein